MSVDWTEKWEAIDRSGLTEEANRVAEKLSPEDLPATPELVDFLPLGLQSALGLETLRQSDHLEGDRMHTVTYVGLPGIALDRAVRALWSEPWDWWQHGRISDWTEVTEGGTRFVLEPVWPWIPSKVGIELEPKQTTAISTPWSEDVAMTSSQARFFADFEGPGRYELFALADGCGFRSIWAGVARTGFKKLMPLRMILSMHLGAESGRVPLPFARGTGFPGLVAHLQKAEKPDGRGSDNGA
jgi:hypothetical protein